MSKKFISLLLVLILTASMLVVSVVSASAADTDKFLTVKATSNYFPETVSEFDSNTKQVTITYYFGCEKDLLNVNWKMYYDPAVLVPSSDSNSLSKVCPTIGKNNCILNLDAKGDTASRKAVNYVASDIKLYNFSSGKKIFASVTFDVVATKAVETTVNLYANIIGVSKLDPNTEVTNPDEEEYLVDFGEVKESSTFVEKLVKLSGVSDVTDDSFLTLNTTSNIFPSVTTKYKEDTKQITVTYYMQAEKDLLNTQWYMYYDPTVLVPALNENGKNINTGRTLCPPAKDCAGAINLSGSGMSENDGLRSIIYSCTNLGLVDFSSEKKIFATAVFDVKATEPAKTEIYLLVDTLKLSIADEETEMTITDEEVFIADGGTVFETSVKVDTWTEATASTYTGVLKGDIDKNGKIDILDVTALQKYIAQLDKTPLSLEVADCNNDGKINILDGTTIQKYIAQLISSFD